VFHGIQRTTFGAAIKSDTRKTIKAIQRLPAELQRRVASDVYLNIRQSNHEIGQARPGEDLSEAVTTQIAKARKLRKRALVAGAGHHSDPAWAAATLFESWAFAMSGRLNETVSSEIIEMIIKSFIARTLSHAEMLELDKRISQPENPAHPGGSRDPVLL